MWYMDGIVPLGTNAHLTARDPNSKNWGDTPIFLIGLDLPEKACMIYASVALKT